MKKIRLGRIWNVMRLEVLHILPTASQRQICRNLTAVKAIAIVRQPSGRLSSRDAMEVKAAIIGAAFRSRERRELFMPILVTERGVLGSVHRNMFTPEFKDSSGKILQLYGVGSWVRGSCMARKNTRTRCIARFALKKGRWVLRSLEPMSAGLRPTLRALSPA